MVPRKAASECALAIAAVLLLASLPAPRRQSSGPEPTFYRDVLPILEKHCQTCHRPGEMGPFSLVTYEQARKRAQNIGDVTREKVMPPWFADPKVGKFSNDPSLDPQEISTLTAWAESSAPAGNPADAPAPPHWTEGWNIPSPDSVQSMPQPVKIPARGDVEYTYEIVPTGFTEDRWVQMSELRPSSRAHVHHAVVYIRPPDSQWLRHAPVGAPFTASTLRDEKDRREAHGTDSDLLLVYAPGSSPDHWPEGYAKFLPRGSDLVFQMHYTTNGHAATDQTSLGLVFLKTKPAKRVITLQLTNHTFIIPPGDPDFHVEVHGSLPNDALLLSFFPHMHLRGKRFEYNLVHPGGGIEPLLVVNYHFHWQFSYRLEAPLALKAGTVLEAEAWYDNSKKNPHNPDPDAAVRWGDQTYEEMMIGFFDVAVAPEINKWQFFVRTPPARLK